MTLREFKFCTTCYQMIFNVRCICVICNKRKTKDPGFWFLKNSDTEQFSIYFRFCWLSYFRGFHSINFSELLIEWEWIKIWMGLCRYFRQVSPLQDIIYRIFSFKGSMESTLVADLFLGIRKRWNLSILHLINWLVNVFIFTCTWGHTFGGKISECPSSFIVIKVIKVLISEGCNWISCEG